MERDRGREREIEHAKNSEGKKECVRGEKEQARAGETERARARERTKERETNEVSVHTENVVHVVLSANVHQRSDGREHSARAEIVGVS